MLYIYKHTNKANNKAYVGITNDLKMRWYHHRQSAKAGEGYLFARALRKYGDSDDVWEHTTLEIFEDEKEALAAENKWILHYRTNEPKFGYNLSSGGERPAMSESTKEKIRELAIERMKDPERRAEIARKIKANWDSKTSEEIETWKAARKIVAQTPESKAKFSRAAKQRTSRPGWRENHSQKLKEKFEKSGPWNKQKEKYNREELLKLYQELNTVKAVAEKLGCKPATLNAYFKRNDIPINSKKYKKESKYKITTDEILYLASNCSSIKEIADKMKIEISAIRRYVKKENLRNQIESLLIRENIKHQESRYTSEMVLDAARSSATHVEIGKKLNCPSNHVNYLGKLFNITNQIETVMNRRIIDISKEDLEKVYSENNLKETAKIFGVAPGTIKKFLAKYGII